MLNHVTEVGTYFQARLDGLAAKHAAIVDVRGMGLMLAVELDSADLAKQVAGEMLERRIIINARARRCCGFCRRSFWAKAMWIMPSLRSTQFLPRMHHKTAGAATIGGKHVG